MNKVCAAFLLLCVLPFTGFSKTEKEAFDAWKSLTKSGNEAMDGKKYDEAERLFQQAFEEIKEFGLSPSLAGTFSNLGRVMAAKGQPEKAEKYYTNAVGISQKTRGNLHRDTALDLHNLARIEFELNKLDLAAEHISVALSIMTQLGLKDDPAADPMVEQWARILEKKGDTETARKLRASLKKTNPAK